MKEEKEFKIGEKVSFEWDNEIISGTVVEISDYGYTIKNGYNVYREVSPSKII